MLAITKNDNETYLLGGAPCTSAYFKVLQFSRGRMYRVPPPPDGYISLSLLDGSIL